MQKRGYKKKKYIPKNQMPYPLKNFAPSFNQYLSKIPLKHINPSPNRILHRKKQTFDYIGTDY